MPFTQISDFFDLRPAKEIRFDVSRALKFTYEDGTVDNISLVVEDNDTVLPFVKADGSTSNIPVEII
tara:strand:- start:11459 stop:11659 length:201 start_codon:yes stop_codon:yes gene_type:complete